MTVRWLQLLYFSTIAYFIEAQQLAPALYPQPDQRWDFTPQLPAIKTRNLSGGKSSDGSNATNAMVLELMRIGLLGGYALRRIKMFNDRIYLARYRRSYWFGTRYYHMDNTYYLETRDTCAYRMNATERDNLEYEEDGGPILDVIFQCQKYAQYCCGLDCCQQTGKRWIDPSVSNFAFVSFHYFSHFVNMLVFLLIAILI